MNNVLNKAIMEFNTFKHEKEQIYTFQTYKGKWTQIGAFLVITADYKEDEDNKDKCHINYHHNFEGSDRFNQWLSSYDFFFEWFDEKHGYLYLKMLFD